MGQRAFPPIAILLVMPLLWSSAVWAQGAVPELPEDAEVRGRLGPGAVGKIDKYVDYWVQRMRQGKNIGEVVEARKGLVNGYSRHETAYYQLAYAGSAAGRVAAVFCDSDRAKQIQAALTRGAIPPISVQPALEKMAAHANPAVRYWAVRGYRQAARLLMIQGGGYAQKMLATLERMGRTESPGPIVAGVFLALTPYREAGRQETARLTEALDRVWLARCEDIVAGKVGLIDAFRKAERFVEPAGPGDNKRVVQLLADAMEAATQALMRDPNRKKPIAGALRELLASMETKLTRLTAGDKRPIQSILTNDQIDLEKATQARLTGWNEYWKPVLQKLGVTVRFVAAATSVPASPATTSTAPAGG